MNDDDSIAADKALILKANQLIAAGVTSADPDEAEQEPKQYLVYFDSPMKGRSLYLLTDDEYKAEAARSHIDSYYATRNLASVEVRGVDAPVDEMPRYATSDELYRDLWW